jgi:hypothetical protein
MGRFVFVQVCTIAQLLRISSFRKCFMMLTIFSAFSSIFSSDSNATTFNYVGKGEQDAHGLSLRLNVLESKLDQLLEHIRFFLPLPP